MKYCPQLNVHQTTTVPSIRVVSIDTAKIHVHLDHRVAVMQYAKLWLMRQHVDAQLERKATHIELVSLPYVTTTKTATTANFATALTASASPPAQIMLVLLVPFVLLKIIGQFVLAHLADQVILTCVVALLHKLLLNVRQTLIALPLWHASIRDALTCALAIHVKKV